MNKNHGIAIRKKVCLNYRFSVDFTNFCFHFFLESGSTEFIIRHFDIDLIVLGYCYSFCSLQNAIVHKFLNTYFCYIVTQTIFYFIYNVTKENNPHISGFIFDVTFSYLQWFTILFYCCFLL